MLVAAAVWNLAAGPAVAAPTRDEPPAADPDAPARAAAWNQVLFWDPVTLGAVNGSFASPPLDAAMGFLSNRVLLVAAPLGAVPYTLQTRGPQPALELTATLGAAEAAAGGIGFGIKALARRPRPYVVDPGLRTPDGFEDSHAFPSGHSAVAFAWATVLALDEPALAVPAYLLASGIGLSRMYNGVHYPTDIVGGAALGALTGFAVRSGREALRAGGYLPAR